MVTLKKRLFQRGITQVKANLAKRISLHRLMLPLAPRIGGLAFRLFEAAMKITVIGIPAATGNLGDFQFGQGHQVASLGQAGCLQETWKGGGKGLAHRMPGAGHRQAQMPG